MARALKRTINKIFVFFNALFMLAGLALLALGAYVRVKDNDYNDVLGKGGPFAPANIMIAAGVVVFVIAFVGCVGAIRESKCLLVLFIVFIVCVLMAETATIVLAFVYRSEAQLYVENAIKKSIQKSYGETAQSAVTKAVDNIQKNFKCCGASNYTDWQGSLWVQKNSNLQVPSSCCSDGTSTCTNVNASISLIFSKPCVAELTDWAKKNLAIVGGLAAGVLLIELLAILFAAIIINRHDSVHAV